MRLKSQDALIRHPRHQCTTDCQHPIHCSQETALELWRRSRSSQKTAGMRNPQDTFVCLAIQLMHIPASNLSGPARALVLSSPVKLGCTSNFTEQDAQLAHTPQHQLQGMLASPSLTDHLMQSLKPEPLHQPLTQICRGDQNMCCAQLCTVPMPRVHPVWGGRLIVSSCATVATRSWCPLILLSRPAATKAFKSGDLRDTPHGLPPA